VRLVVIPHSRADSVPARGIIELLGLVPTGIRHPHVRVYENPSAVPRAYVTYRARESPSDPELLERLSRSDFDPLASSYFDRPPELVQPAVLLALVLIVPLAWLMRRSPRVRGGRGVTALLLRLLVIVACVLALARPRLVDEVTRLSDYHRALLGAFARAPETGPLHLTLAADLVSAVSAELEVMARRRQLARWVRIDQLAAQLTTACISATMAWAAGGVVDTRLRAFAEQSVALMLLGVVRGAAREEVEARLQAAQDVLSGVVASHDPEALPVSRV